jgi:hypothetical protein
MFRASDRWGLRALITSTNHYTLLYVRVTERDIAMRRIHHTERYRRIARGRILDELSKRFGCPTEMPQPQRVSEFVLCDQVVARTARWLWSNPDASLVSPRKAAPRSVRRRGVRYIPGVAVEGDLVIGIRDRVPLARGLKDARYGLFAEGRV